MLIGKLSLYLGVTGTIFLFTLTASAFDSNCNKLLPQGSNGKPNIFFSESWAEKQFAVAQKNLKSQEAALQPFLTEVPDCILRTSGIRLNSEQKIEITNVDQFKTFRMAGNVPQCDLYRTEFVSSRYLSTSQQSDQIATIVNQNVGTAQAINMGVYNSPHDSNQAFVQKKLVAAQSELEQLQNVSFDNYCANQFVTDALTREEKQISNLNNQCSELAKQSPETLASNPACANWPDALISKTNALSAKNPILNSKDPFNQVDSKLYSPFADNATKLKKALADAKEKYGQSVRNFNHAAHPPTAPLTNCSKKDWEAVTQYNQSCKAGGIPNIGNLKTFTDEANKINQATASADLISEMNKHIFQSVVASLTVVAKPGSKEEALFRDLKNNPDDRYGNLQKLCAQYGISSNSDTCKNPEYANVLRGTMIAQNKGFDPGHQFMRADPKEVYQRALGAVQDLRPLCDRIIRVADNSASVKELQSDVYAEFQKTSSKIINDPILGPYLSTKPFAGMVKGFLSEFSPGQMVLQCQLAFTATGLALGSDGPTDPLDKTAADAFEKKREAWFTDKVKNAQDEFRDTVKEEAIKMGEAGTPPNYGNHSNSTGAGACAMLTNGKPDLPGKNRLYTLYSQFSTYPIQFGAVLAKYKKSDREVYETAICDAMRCNQKVSDKNELYMNGAKIAILAASATGVGAPLAMIAAAGVITFTDLSKKLLNANDEISKTQAGLANGGLILDEAIAKRLRDSVQKKEKISSQAVLATGSLVIGAGALNFGGSAAQITAESTAEVTAIEEANAIANFLNSPTVASTIAKLQQELLKVFGKKAAEGLAENLKEQVQDVFAEALHESGDLKMGSKFQMKYNAEIERLIASYQFTAEQDDLITVDSDPGNKGTISADKIKMVQESTWKQIGINTRGVVLNNNES